MKIDDTTYCTRIIYYILRYNIIFIKLKITINNNSLIVVPITITI